MTEQLQGKVHRIKSRRKSPQCPSRLEVRDDVPERRVDKTLARKIAEPVTVVDEVAPEQSSGKVLDEALCQDGVLKTEEYPEQDGEQDSS